MRKSVTASGIVATGPYAHAVESEGLLFLSGQTPIDPVTGKLIQGGVAEQTQLCFDNLKSVLQAAGLTLDDVQKVNVYLLDMGNFAVMNAVYEKNFSQPYPARTTVQVGGLPLGAEVEIEMVARRPKA
ncbi:2-iminobutanoate/2-iminopropanoate deaminase [Saezia sanguinis]|uniref:2-iminobutanoate/2-iminopropanoate deaminase n=1 Tax=Saezia sanguinis TaxID=1965230 RepID=A0A433SBJ7_9BURK|nr:Rid family detoxifying hydrolase [Saezia sanguinis]RUS66105.1 2-iminobutanoate/2-iminopropanoate deaminase [Saezia sanguinis]